MKVVTTLKERRSAYSLMDKVVHDHMVKLAKEKGDRMEYILRFIMPNPIKGEITKNKVVQRGLYRKVFCVQTGGVFEFIGINPSRSGKRQAWEYPVFFDNYDPEEFQKFLIWQRDKDTRRDDAT